MWSKDFIFKKESALYLAKNEEIYGIVHVMLQTDRILEHAITCQNMFLAEMVSYYIQSPIQGIQM